jgi:poly-gamma-glutamate capsule biosynthesis protein CapA/YwtB (metallophosphatase superfamily)
MKINSKFIGLIILIPLLLIPVTTYSLPAESNDLFQIPTQKTTGTIVAVGDLSFSGIDPIILQDPEYPWADTKEILETATILVGNQEIPFTSRGSVYTNKKWILRADPGTAQSLTTAGFDVVTLANNHIMDYGPIGLQDTLTALDDANIAHAGAGMNLEDARRPVIITTPDGVKFAFLAYSLVYPEVFWANSRRPGTPYGDPACFVPDIQKAKTMADYVVVSFHWSDELYFYPFWYQKVYGKKCIDAGASIVLGHHPHVLQGLEVYNGGLIAYSLGNFVFGSRSARVKDSVILAIEYDRDGLIQAKLYPVNVNNLEVEFQTKLRHGADAERVLQDLRKYSEQFHTKIESQGEIGVIKIRE